MDADISYEARTGAPAGSVPHSRPEELLAVIDASCVGFEQVSRVSPQRRRTWLDAVATALEAHRDELTLLADCESALGVARLDGEVARTADQLRFYADAASEGRFLDAVVGPHLARTGMPLGPIAVFGASNFPFAFGALGNDTASALAAGCSVVVKAHPAHPLTSARTVELAQHALTEAGAPHGTLGAVVGFEQGLALVDHPSIAAVAFTGSQRAGMSLWERCRSRGVPVYAEMGTVNPVVVTPSAAPEVTTIAKGFAGSCTLGSGQYCTKPGLFLAPHGAGAAPALGEALRQIAVQPVMLTRGIAEAVQTGIEALRDAGAELIAHIPSASSGWSAPAAVLSAPLSAVTEGSRVVEECFGAVAVVIEYSSVAEAVEVIDGLQGALAASLFAADADPDAAVFLDRLGRRVGRVVVGDWPTGVAVDWAQQHGGPWPATTDPRATSVGAAALERFVRPVAYQAVPDELLPPPLQSGNPWAIARREVGS
ncbi:aldehyde dehydrogenase family protein [Pseudonocardia kujensis]|uniref:aldehyde dehydrogenase family protein n=1 Tax=Pseudonocardia kujensis TaxID=1128675 RepID=UPI001E647C97|nr:aldehyde dehydrogenase family protein [Pseudonocardia kujensis]MCE0764962.1 aldehyde dehydrogenase family protein [Pseudonocardia kujensis]